MKLIGFSLFCLLCALGCTFVVLQEVDEAEATTGSSETNPLPISLIYTDGLYVLSMANKLNWFQATASCANMGYSLVAIPTERNQTRIMQTIRRSGFLRAINEPIWTSGSNLANNNQWNWYSTGKHFQYRRFLDRAAATTYGCLGLNAVTGGWIVEDCAEERYFMCQKRCW